MQRGQRSEYNSIETNLQESEVVAKQKTKNWKSIKWASKWMSKWARNETICQQTLIMKMLLKSEATAEAATKKKHGK